MPAERTWAREADQLPAAPGAYALLLTVAEAIPLAPRFAHPLPPGRYCYLGSAKGAGGIRARCGRHLAGPRKVHWHIDRLTGRASQMHTLALPGACECDLVRRLLEHTGVAVPLARFGSSDCRRCPAHLLSVNEVGPRRLARWLTES
jgi:Uri superfamily endonuclease